MKHTYVIAEVGSAHCGLITSALELVRMAKQVGADAVKFQFWSSGAKLAAQRHATEYEEIYEGYALPERWLSELADVARHIGIDFLCTAYLPEDVAVVAPHVAAFKIASFEAEYRPLLRAHRLMMQGNNKRLFVSLGMGATLDAAKDVLSLDVCERVVPMHCVSAYPATTGHMNISMVSWLKSEHGVAGFSDHFTPKPLSKNLVGALAVAAGASVVEAHLRLDSTPRSNPDYPHSMAPEGFNDYVWTIRTAETLLGNGTPGMQAIERASAQFKSTEVISGKATSKK